MTPKVNDSIAGDIIISRQHFVSRHIDIACHRSISFSHTSLPASFSMAWHPVKPASTYRAILHLRLTWSGNDNF
jgi:hypothetical protein